MLDRKQKVQRIENRARGRYGGPLPHYTHFETFKPSQVCKPHSTSAHTRCSLSKDAVVTYNCEIYSSVCILFLPIPQHMVLCWRQVSGGRRWTVQKFTVKVHVPRSPLCLLPNSSGKLTTASHPKEHQLPPRSDKTGLNLSQAKDALVKSSFQAIPACGTIPQQGWKNRASPKVC